MQIKEVAQLTSEEIFSWVKVKVIEGKTLNDILTDPDYLSLESKIRLWRENPVTNALIPEAFNLPTQVRAIYENNLNPYTCFLGEYNINYYIQKLEKIPAEMWCVGESELPNGQKDVWGHCGHKPISGQNALNSEEAVRLYVMTINFLGNLTTINDGEAKFNGGVPLGTNPRDRVVNALKFFKYEMEDAQLKDYKKEQDEKEFPTEKE